MLYRGIYADSETKPRIPWTFRSAFSKIIGIDQYYTKGDKILAWSVFLWSFGYGFCLCFIGIIIWKAIFPGNRFDLFLTLDKHGYRFVKTLTQNKTMRWFTMMVPEKTHEMFQQKVQVFYLGNEIPFTFW